MTDRVRVWDPVIRIFHWGLVIAFATAWLTADEIQPVHEFAGYTVAALIAVRVLWGFFGPRHARFSQFVRGPVATARYLGDMARGRETRYLGHNPAGGAMVVAILLTLSGTAFTGWLMTTAPRPAAVAVLTAPALVTPAYADDDEDEGREYGEEAGERGGGALKEVHETLANLMLLLVALHLAGVVLASVRHRENLARSMVTGDKRPAEPDDIA